MINMCNIIHNDYDRISDKVMWIGTGAILNFSVDLYCLRKDVKSTDKIKDNFHREILYKQNYDDPYKVKIVRDFTYYFSIDYNFDKIKERVIIGPEQIYFVIFNLKRVIQWFIGESGVNTVFSKKNNGLLFIPNHPDPIRVNLAFGSYIEFEPAINTCNGIETIGVKTYLNSDGVFFFMSSDQVFSLYHMLSTCNMYTLAQNMLNYIGRPENGTNPYIMGIDNTTNTNSSSGTFFNRVGAKPE